MLTDEEAFRLIDVRSRVMDEAARSNPGAMTALLKADEESVMALCEQCAQGDVLAPANFNCPGQIVVAGTVPAIERAEEAWREQGGKLSRLATQGAFHSPLMQAGMRSVCGVSRDRRLQGAGHPGHLQYRCHAT